MLLVRPGLLERRDIAALVTRVVKCRRKTASHVYASQALMTAGAPLPLRDWRSAQGLLVRLVKHALHSRCMCLFGHTVGVRGTTNLEDLAETISTWSGRCLSQQWRAQLMLVRA